MAQNKHRIFLVDDHPIVRQGLTLLINQEPDLTVCGTASDAHSALTSVIEIKPDMLITDVSMSGPDGLQLVKQLLAHLPDLPILVLSIHDEMLYAERALKAGARGYIMKHEVESTILTAIRCILNGKIYVSAEMTNHLLNITCNSVVNPLASPVKLLSDRELQIFEIIGRGLSGTEIAEELKLNIKTIETYILRIRQKLHLSSTREVTCQAVLWVQDKHPGN